MWWWRCRIRENNRNCGGGFEGLKSIEMWWWWWWWWRENNRDAVVVVLEGKQ